VNNYNGYDITLVDSIEEAKHFKNKTTPKQWIKNSVQSNDDALKTAQESLADQIAGNPKNNANSYYVNRCQNVCASLKKIQKWLKNATVVSADLEAPNFPSHFKLRWNRYQHDHASIMRLESTTHGRYYCKACGVVLKNIPFYELPNGNSTKICVGCLYLRQESIKKAFESMPEDFRTGFINELIIGGL